MTRIGQIYADLKDYWAGRVRRCGRAPRKSLGSGFPLQVRALITGLAGFLLQSVTRMAPMWLVSA